MKISGPTTSNTIAVILTIAVLVLAWKMVLPAYYSHKSNLDSLSQEVDAAKTKLDSIEKSKSELNAIKPITDQLLVAVPKGPDEPDLISELEAIAIKNNIVLPSITIDTQSSESEQGSSASSSNETMQQSAATPATVSTTENTAESSVTANESSSGAPILITLSVSGSFDNLNNFMTGLENSVRFMNITGLTYGTDTETGDLTLSLQIEAYQR